LNLHIWFQQLYTKAVSLVSILGTDCTDVHVICPVKYTNTHTHTKPLQLLRHFLSVTFYIMKVYMQVFLWIHVFWHMMLCFWISGFCSSKAAVQFSGSTYPKTHIPENLSHQQQNSENLKSCRFTFQSPVI